MKKALTGSYAVAEAMRQINPDVVAAYPITPQTQIMDRFSEFVANGLVDTELIRAESEHSALSACVGSSAAGARTMTASCSQGLALMFEILYVASGLRLPIIMNITNRALSAPINIHCDHSDSIGCRDSSWIQFYCENVQEAYDLTLISTKLAENKDILLPVMICQDGFITSHGVEAVELLEDKKVKNFVKEYKPKFSLLKNNITYGPHDPPAYYFDHKIQQVQAMNNVKKIFKKISKEFFKISKRKYNLFETYKLNDAEIAIVCMSSTAGTVKFVIDELRKKGIKTGLLKPIMFRPFPYKEISNTIKNTKAIAVLDRAASIGSYASLFSEIRNSLYNQNKKPNLVSYVYGLGGRDITLEEINSIFKNLLKIKNKKLKDKTNYLIKNG